MATRSFQGLPGTRDLLPPDTDRIRQLTTRFADAAAAAGFGQVIPPMFEEVAVFDRLGAASDVVAKELYAFNDKGGRHIALRPEFTASVCRIFNQHRPVLPWKVWYYGPSFRYDRPQKGRYRQFDQLGVEAIGSHDPDLDTEIIALAARFFEHIGLRQVTLLINSLGDADDRPRYLDALRAHFAANLDALSEQSRTTLDVNPLRVLDSKRPQDAEVITAAPILAEYLSDAAAAAFDRVCAGLDALQISYEIAPRLVRGLDYYTRTTFEFAASSLDAAQNAVGGGGRYDGLVADLGGPSEPGVGFALGVDRILLAAEAEQAMVAPSPELHTWIVHTDGGLDGLIVADELRSAGFRVDRAEPGKSMKAQMKGANRSGAQVAVIIGPDEAASSSVSLRPLRRDGAQITVARAEMVKALKELLES